jgi:hypothetical protein
MTDIYLVASWPNASATADTCAVVDDIELKFCPSSEYLRYLIYCETRVKMPIVL